jgi:hypothetical protein
MHRMSVILVETVEERLTAALHYSAWLLDRLDPTQRLSHIVVAAQIIGGFAVAPQRHDDTQNLPNPTNRVGVIFIADAPYGQNTPDCWDLRGCLRVEACVW